MKGRGSGRPPPPIKGHHRDDNEEEAEADDLAALEMQMVGQEQEEEEEDEPMISPLAGRSSPPSSFLRASPSPSHHHHNPDAPLTTTARRTIVVPLQEPPPPSQPPSQPPPPQHSSSHCSKAPSDLHLWVEPGLADAQVQAERRAAKRREALSGLLHRPTLPCVAWLKQYRPRRDFLWDLQAGIVVGVMVIPQGMAYAGLAGLSPIFGLYCAITPAFIYCLFGPSRESAIGAMALVSIMVGDAVASLTPTGAPLADRVAVATKMAFLVGVFQVVLGLFKMGEIATYVSHPVMQGFSSGGEILIAISQLKMLFGIKVPSKKYAWQTLYHLFAHIEETQPWTLLMGVVTCAFLYGLSRWRRQTKARIEAARSASVPRRTRVLLLLANFGPFAAIIVTALIAYGMAQRGVAPDVVGKVPQGLHTYPSYAFSAADLQHLAQPAFIIALISFMLSYAVSKKYSEKARYAIDCNQELFAIGLAHALGSLFGAFPVAGSFSRTAVAVESNQRSQISGLVTATMVLLAVNFLTGTFYWIPQCALAALVQAAIFTVMDFSPFRYAYRASKSEFTIMLVTFLVTLGLGIDKGILAGVALSIVALVRRTSHPRLKVLGVVPGRRAMFRDVTRYHTAQELPGLCITRIDESLNFASCASIKDQLLHIARDPGYVRRHHRSSNGGGSGIASGAPSPIPSFLGGGGGSNVGSPILNLMRSLPGGLSGLRSNQSSLIGPRGLGQPSEEPRPRPETLVIDFSGVNHVDLSGVKTLDEVQATLAREGTAVYVCNVKSSVRDKLKDTPIWDRLGGDLLFLSLPALLDHLVGRGQWGGGEGEGPGSPSKRRGEQQQPPASPEEQQQPPLRLKDILFDGYRYNDWVI